MRILQMLCLAIGIPLFLAGALFKLESWRGASQMLIIGICLLAVPMVNGSLRNSNTDY
jgi:hypothetical protein